MPQQYYQSNTAVGSLVELSVVSSASTGRVDSIYRTLWRKIFQFERQFSRFLPGSELSLFNRNAGSKQLITPVFRAILRDAMRMSEETDGLFNPFILPALQSAGYDHSFVPGHEQDVQDDHSQKAVTTADRLEIGSTWARIPYGTALDLGGCGKGYLADRLADYIQDKVQGYWFSLGGDIIASGTDGQSLPWRINIQKAGVDGSKNIGWIETIPLSRNAIATSGTTVKKGIKNGETWHHLIDPRTRKPADTDVILATVCDTSALKADVLASCAVILGTKNGAQLLRSKQVRAALFQSESEGLSFHAQFGPGLHITKTISTV